MKKIAGRNYRERLHKLKKLIHDHPYISTYYISEKYPNELFKEEDFGFFREDIDAQRYLL